MAELRKEKYSLIGIAFAVLSILFLPVALKFFYMPSLYDLPLLFAAMSIIFGVIGGLKKEKFGILAIALGIVLGVIIFIIMSVSFIIE
jgi:hypothetical protein